MCGLQAERSSEGTQGSKTTRRVAPVDKAGNVCVALPRRRYVAGACARENVRRGDSFVPGGTHFEYWIDFPSAKALGYFHRIVRRSKRPTGKRAGLFSGNLWLTPFAPLPSALKSHPAFASFAYFAVLFLLCVICVLCGQSLRFSAFAALR